MSATSNTTSDSSSDSSNPRARLAWSVLEWLLFAMWILDAALVMAHRHAAFFTNHAADLTLPAWLYVVSRRTRGSARSWRRWFVTAPPVLLAVLIFVASAATEISQYFWPHGIFPGTFDPLDIVAYGVGLGLCCIADLRWPIPS